MTAIEMSEKMEAKMKLWLWQYILAWLQSGSEGAHLVWWLALAVRPLSVRWHLNVPEVLWKTDFIPWEWGTCVVKLKKKMAS